MQPGKSGNSRTPAREAAATKPPRAVIDCTPAFFVEVRRDGGSPAVSPDVVGNGIWYDAAARCAVGSGGRKNRNQRSHDRTSRPDRGRADSRRVSPGDARDAERAPEGFRRDSQTAYSEPGGARAGVRSRFAFGSICNREAAHEDLERQRDRRAGQSGRGLLLAGARAGRTHSQQEGVVGCAYPDVPRTARALRPATAFCDYAHRRKGPGESERVRPRPGRGAVSRAVARPAMGSEGFAGGARLSYDLGRGRI